MCFDSHFVICVLCAVVSSGGGGSAPGARFHAVSLLGGWLGRGFWVGSMVYRFFFSCVGTKFPPKRWFYSGDSVVWEAMICSFISLSFYLWLLRTFWCKSFFFW